MKLCYTLKLKDSDVSDKHWQVWTGDAGWQNQNHWTPEIFDDRKTALEVLNSELESSASTWEGFLVTWEESPRYCRKWVKSELAGNGKVEL